jgi:chaperone BCS1
VVSAKCEVFVASLTRFLINDMSAPSTDLVLAPPTVSTELWPEPLDSPGIVPRHLKRAATASFPVLEVLQRILYRLRPTGTSTTGDLERVLAVIGLYQAVRPVYNHLKEFFLWACTVQITVPESDPVAKDIMAWMGAEVIPSSRTRSAIMVTGGTENNNPIKFHPTMRFPGSNPDMRDPADDVVVCLPPMGTRIFW